MACRNHPDAFEGLRLCYGCSHTFCDDCLVLIGDKPYCAQCKSEKLLDVRSGVQRDVLPYAGLMSRFIAMIIDMLLLYGPMYVLIFWWAFAEPERMQHPLAGFIGIPFVFVYLLYEGLMTQARSQTLGKMAVGVKIVRPDGSPMSAGQAWGRAAMRMVLGCLWIVDYIPAFFTPEKTALHDLVAATRVVRVRA